MSKIVVLLDDAGYARQQLVQQGAATGRDPASRWILVACAPRMTHRVSKWVSHGTREHWRAKWAARLFGELDDWLAEHLPGAERQLARGPLPDLLKELQPDEVLDLRRPKSPAWEGQSHPEPGTLAALGSLLLAWTGLTALTEA
jgi:hypothetical protein